MKNVTSIFESDSTTANVYGLWQWDYGQILRIQGLHLPSMVEIHFSLQETGGTSLSRIGVTKDGVTEVPIPDSMLENDSAANTYYIYAFIFLTDATSGQTEYKIKLQVKSRPKPEIPGGGEDPDIFHEAVRKVAESADQAAESECQAEGWAHGREDLPERAQDNAKYYAGKAAEDAKKTGADRKEVERLVESVSGIDQQVEKVEELAKQAQGAATKAGESEQASKDAQKLAESAKAAAETAADKTAEDWTAVDNAKAEVLKAEESVSGDRAAVESTKKEIDQLKDDIPTEVQDGVQKVNDARDAALGDISKTGTAHKTAVESAGTKAVETITRTQTKAVGAVNTAQTEAVEAVETAKTGAVKTVQTEGTTQTGNVTAEGEKQVQDVQAAAQEIIADREQISKNAGDITVLQEEVDASAPGIVENASGEIIVLDDSSDRKLKGLSIYGKSTQITTTGAQLLNPELFDDSFTSNGITVTAQSDGSIKFTGTPIDKEAVYTPTLYLGEYVDLLEDGQEYRYTTQDPSYYGRIRYVENGETKYNFNFIFRKNIISSVKPYVQVKIEEYRDGMVIRPMFFRGNLSDLLPWEPYTGGKPSPSPEYPQDIMIPGMDGEVSVTLSSGINDQKISIQTPNGLPGIPVTSDGNYTDETGQQWICDEIDLARGKYVQRVVNTVLNSSLGSLFVGTHSNGTKCLSIDINIKVKNSSINMCEMYKGSLWTQSIGYVYAPNNNNIVINDNRFTDTGTAKKIIDTEQAKLLYIMDTPAEHDLPPEVIEAYKALHTNYPTTVITNDSGAGMEVGYVADTKLYIAEKIEEPLQKQITDLQNALISQKISGGGDGLKAEGSADLPVKSLKLFGKSEQVTWTGDNMWHGEIENIRGTTNGVIANAYGSYVVPIVGGKYYTISIEIEDTIFHSTTATFPQDGTVIVDSYTGSSGKKVKNKTMSTSPEAKFLIINFGTTNDVGKVMLNEGKEAKPYEPYTGGKPSPSPEYPQEIIIPGEGGEISVVLTDGMNNQKISIPTPNGLPGIPVKSDGNYTDETGQQWICDEIEYQDGQAVYVQRCELANVKDVFGEITVLEDNSFNIRKGDAIKTNRTDIICSHFVTDGAPWVSENYRMSYSGAPHYQLRVKMDGWTKEQAEEFFRNTNVYVLYILSEPVVSNLSKKILETLKSLHTYRGSTEITTGEDINVVMEYTVDTKKYVDAQIADISRAVLARKGF